MGFSISLLMGIIIGGVATYLRMQTLHRQAIRKYESQIRTLKNRHQQIVEDASRNISLGKRSPTSGEELSGGHNSTQHIHSTVNPKEHSRPSLSEARREEQDSTSRKKKSYSVEEIRKTYARAYQPWTSDEEDRLKESYQMGMTIDNLATSFQRKPGGIRSRLKKMGLLK